MLLDISKDFIMVISSFFSDRRQLFTILQLQNHVHWNARDRISRMISLSKDIQVIDQNFCYKEKVAHKLQK